MKELAAAIEPLPENVDVATALLAEYSPSAIATATITTTIRTSQAERFLEESKAAAEAAEQTYERTYLSPTALSLNRKQIRKLLEGTLASEQAAERLKERQSEDLLLAGKVNKRSRELTNPLRRASMFAGAIALAGSIAYAGNQVASSIENHTTAHQHSSGAASARATSIISDGLGILLGLPGGAGAGLALAEQFEGQEAHRRAVKILRRARSKP